MFVMNIDQADFLFQSGIYSEIMIDQNLSHSHRDYGLKRFRHATIKLDTTQVDEIEKLCINALEFFQDQTEGYLWLANFCVVHFVMLQNKDHIDRKNEVICGKFYDLDLGLLPSVAEFDQNVNQVIIKKPETQDWILLVQKTLSREIKVAQKNWIRATCMIILGIALIVGIYRIDRNIPTPKVIIEKPPKVIIEKPWIEPDLGIIDRDGYKKSLKILDSKYDEKFTKNTNLLNTYLEKTDHQSKIDILDQYFCKSDTKIENITADDMKSQQINDSHQGVIINSSEKLLKLKDSIIEVKCPQKKK